jgi:predicted  nucleic acid-binding Zn-ribbon protein
LDDEDPIKTSTTTISSSQDAEVQHLTNEIERLRKDIEKSEIEIDESSQTIDNLNIELKKTNETLRKEVLQKIEAEKELKLRFWA